MTALVGKRRRRTAVAGAIAALAIVGAAVSGYVGAKALTSYEGGSDARQTLPIVRLPKNPVGALATVDAEGGLTSVTVMILAQEQDGLQRGGSIISIPMTADANVGVGDVRLPLTQAFLQGGVEGLRTALASALAVNVSHLAVLDETGVVDLLTPLAPFNVDLPDPVNGGGDGPPTLVLASGAQTLSAGDAADVLVSRVDGLADATRRPNLTALWTGFAATVGSGIQGDTSPTTVVDFASLWEHLIAGPVGARGLLAEPASESTNPAGLDVDILNVPDTRYLFAWLAPDAMSSPLPGLTVMIRTRPGTEAKVRDLVNLVVSLGGNVVSVMFDAPEQTQTDIIVYDDRNKEDVPAVNGVLGEVAFPEPTRVVDKINVEFVLGSSFLESGTIEFPSVTTTTIAG